jgi:asparaginyl-tRNA synthetase
MKRDNMMHKKIKSILESSASGEDVTIKGWIRTRRDSKGGFSFLEINDGSCMSNLQVIADAGLPNYEEEIKRLYPGCSVEVSGSVKESRGGKQRLEIHAAGVTLIGACDPEAYTIGKQRVSFEVLREIPHLRTRTNTFGAVARVRNALSVAVHDFFQERGFLYINTPIITASDCEGAGELFRVTTLDLEELPGSPGVVDYSGDFFKKPSYLTVSGQLELEAYACSLGDVYTFGPTFRAENSNTSRHLSEFWMIEPEMAFADLDRDMELARDFITQLFRYVLDNCEEDMTFFNQRIDKTVIETLQSIISSEFRHITYTEAVAILESSGHKFEFPVKWGMDMQSEHERYLTEQKFRGPVIVTDYPAQIKPFYMKLNQDGRTVRAMDVLLPKVGEIIGGSQREDDPAILEQRMKAQGIEPESLSWYTDLRRFGTVPHAGFGLGFERLVQFTTGMSNIRDVIPYPRTPGLLEI